MIWLAWLCIAGAVLIAGAIIGWLARGWLESGHERRCPAHRDITAEWAAVWRSVQDEMEDG